MVVVGNHGLSFRLGKLSQHVVNDVGFQAVDVVQSRSTDRELHIDVLENQLPDAGVFSGRRAVVLDGVAPLSASIAGLHAELIAGAIGSHGARQTTHLVSQTQSDEHRIISGATTLTVTTSSKASSFFQIGVILIGAFKHLQFFFALTTFVVCRQLLTHSTVDIAANGLGNLDDGGSVQGGNFCFQSGNHYSHFSFDGFHSGGDFGFNSRHSFSLLGFNCVQFF